MEYFEVIFDWSASTRKWQVAGCYKPGPTFIIGYFERCVLKGEWQTVIVGGTKAKLKGKDVAVTDHGDFVELTAT